VTKTCVGCGRGLSLGAFGKRACARDGLQSNCRECMAARQLRAFLADPERVRDKSRRYRAQHQDTVRERNRDRKGRMAPAQRAVEAARCRAWEAAHPGVHAAWMLVGHAVRSGRLVKPSACEACGLDGRLHGHHHRGDTDPLDVVWLCLTCHNAAHKALDNEPVPERLGEATVSAD
jgi:hypothetical protein